MDFGEAFVGDIGEHWLYDFTAVGDVVNTAVRLESEAAGGEINLAVGTHGGCHGPSARGAVEVAIKGKARPVPPRRIARGTSLRA